MNAKLLAAAVVIGALAGCGGGIESQVGSQYADYARRHNFDAKASDVERVTCSKEPTRNFDGWCRIHPKGFQLHYDVPYRGDKVLWGESGLMKAP